MLFRSGAMNAVKRIAPVSVQIQGPRPQRTAQTARDTAAERPVNLGLAAQHVCGGGPAGPSAFVLDDTVAAKTFPGATDADRIADGFAGIGNEVQKFGIGIDINAAGRLFADRPPDFNALPPEALGEVPAVPENG